MSEAWPIVVPRDTVNDDFVVFVRWLLPEGSPVQRGVPVAEIETSKAVVEIEAEHDGYLVHGANVLDQVAVGAEVGAVAKRLGAATRPAGAGAANAGASGHAGVSADAGPQGRASHAVGLQGNGSHRNRPTGTATSAMVEAVLSGPAPAERIYSRRARELLAQRPVDEGLFGGRVFIREQDVLAALEPQRGVLPEAMPVGRADSGGAADFPGRGAASLGRGGQAAPSPSARSESAPARGRAPVRDTVPLSPSKRTEVRYLSAGPNTLLSAITVLVPTAGLDAQIAERAAIRRMGYLEFVIAAAAQALKSYPELNAFLADDAIHYYGEINVGVAMNMGQGLMVPVIPRADEQSPEDISKLTAELAMRYLRRELAEADLVRGTFTVTDLSGAGAFHVLPLVNRDQSAILAMGQDGQRPATLSLTLSFDHRVTDGQQASQFLQELKENLEAGAPPFETAPPEPPAPTAQDTACGNCLVTLERLESFKLRGFLLPVMRPEGPGYICSTCLAGWNG